LNINVFAVYIDTATPQCQRAGPPGIAFREHDAVLAEYTNSKGGFPTRAALVILDLYKRYPDADWYVEVDDDTIVGESQQMVLSSCQQ
jgi:hypothetical protein